MQGAKSKYEYRWNKDKLIVTDTSTGIEYEATTIKSGQYRITKQAAGKQSFKYITPEAVACYFRRKQIAELPEEILKVRPNVEATIFQFSFLSRNNKTRYRGLFKHQLWANTRGLWINMRRIQLYLTGENCPQHLKQRFSFVKNGILAPIFGFVELLRQLYDYFEWSPDGKLQIRTS